MIIPIISMANFRQNQYEVNCVLLAKIKLRWSNWISKSNYLCTLNNALCQRIKVNILIRIYIKNARDCMHSNGNSKRISFKENSGHFNVPTIQTLCLVCVCRKSLIIHCEIVIYHNEAQTKQNWAGSLRCRILRVGNFSMLFGIKFSHSNEWLLRW